MKGYRVAEARARFGELLDEAEEGETIFIERHGVRFTLRAEGSPSKGSKKKPVNTIKWAHPAVEAGQWTWEYGPKGLVFKDLRPAAVKARKRGR
jgi:hypothetical protein